MLLILNPLFNPGPLIYRQERMGLNRERRNRCGFPRSLIES